MLVQVVEVKREVVHGARTHKKPCFCFSEIHFIFGASAAGVV